MHARIPNRAIQSVKLHLALCVLYSEACSYRSDACAGEDNSWKTKGHHRNIIDMGCNLTIKLGCQPVWTALTALLEHDLFDRVEATKSGVGTFLGVLGVIGRLTRRF